jgi:hypothetical protein
MCMLSMYLCNCSPSTQVTACVDRQLLLTVNSSIAKWIDYNQFIGIAPFIMLELVLPDA